MGRLLGRAGEFALFGSNVETAGVSVEARGAPSLWPAGMFGITRIKDDAVLCDSQRFLGTGSGARLCISTPTA